MRTVLSQLVVLWVVSGTAATGVAISPAQQADAAKAQDLLPYRDLYTPEEIQKNFRPQQFTPFGNSSGSPRACRGRGTAAGPGLWRHQPAALRRWPHRSSPTLKRPTAPQAG